MKKTGSALRSRSGNRSPASLSRTPFAESYREVVELAPIGIYTSTLEGRFLAANVAFARMLGYDSPEELLRIDIPRELYFDLDDRKSVLSQYEQGTGIVRVETALKRKDGLPVVIQFDSRVVRDAEGRTLGFEGFAHDITERKRAEEELRRSEERFRALVENSSEVIAQLDRDGLLVYASPSVLRIWGNQIQEIVGTLRFDERIHPEDVDAVRRKFHDLLENPEEPVTIEFQGQRKDGSWRVFEAVVVNRLAEPAIGTIVANLRDITVRKRAEEELRRSEERFRALVENSSEVIGLFDREGHWLYASPSVARLWGYSAEEMMQPRIFGSMIHPEDVDAFRERFRDLVARPDAVDTMEFRGRHRDGSWRAFETVGVNRLETPGVGAIVANLRDVTARREAETALKKSEERFRTLIERAPVAIGIGRDGRTIYANEKYQQMYGFQSIDQLRGTQIADQWAPQCRPDIEERVRQRSLGLPVTTEYEGIGQRKDGSQFPVVAAATRVQLADGPATIAFLADITERKRAEEQRASILERVSDAFVALDTDWRYTYLNTKAAQIFGRRREDLVGKHIWSEFPEGVGQLFYKAYYRAAQEQVPIELEEYYPPYDRWFENRIYPSPDGLSIFFRDITERKLGEQRLRLSYEELRALAARMETVREEESSRIARELHDQIGQSLTAIKIHLQTLQRRTDASAIAGELSDSIEMSERLLEQVRNLSLDLRPSVLDDLGLAAALRWYLDRQAQVSGFAAEFSADLPPGRLPRELETACFRVAQQAVTNVAQHARARRVRVDLTGRGNELSISIRDDGVGFDVAAARRRARAGRSLGILGMEERVSLLGGDFEVLSGPSGGTEVRARFPLASSPPDGTD